MNLLYLKYFKDAAFLESFSKAAEVNFVPQSAISKAVKSLEQEYNTTLFDRVGKNIFINENGRYLYQEVCCIFNKLDSCSHHFEQRPTKHIIIYIQDAAFFVPLLCADYMKAHSNTRISFVTANEVTHSTKIPYDLTFMPMLNDMSHYLYEPLATDDLVLLISKDNPLSEYDEIDISMLEGEPFIGFFESMRLRRYMNDICKKNGGFLPNVVFETSDEFAAIHLVAENHGLCMLPENLYHVHEHSNIKVAKIKDTIQTHTVIAWRREKHLSHAEQNFIDFSKKWFKNLPSFSSKTKR